MGPLLVACLLALLPQEKTPDAAAVASRSASRPYDELLLKYAGAGWSGAALVAKNGEVLLAKGYGFADFQRDAVNSEDTLFEIASITKSFTATAIVKLAQARRLTLDESMAVHLPGVPHHSRKITLRHLLSHTSGIPGSNASGRGEDLALAVVDYLGTGPQGKPGGKWEYWNGGYALLAGVIEKVSARPYTQFLEEELFAPAGMSATGFTGDTDLDPTRAALGFSSTGRSRTALEHPYDSYGYQYRGMGGIVTSVRDLFAFERALANHTLLDEAHTRELFTPVENGYALGWYVTRALDGSVRQSHGGAVRGFVSEFRRLPERQACIAVLCNSDDARPREIADNLECLLLGRALVTTPPAGELLGSDEAQACAGVFVNAAGRLVVRAAAGVLMAGVEGQGLLDALGGSGKLDWKADFEALSGRAVEIVEGIAHGNTEPLRTYMAKRIPKQWPDNMRRSIWPAHLNLHGEFRGARPIGALARNERVEVLLALEHEKGPARALIAFGPAGLERLDWQGPQFVASARLEPIRKGVFRVMLGADPKKIEFELGGNQAEGKATSARLAGLKLVRN